MVLEDQNSENAYLEADLTTPQLRGQAMTTSQDKGKMFLSTLTVTQTQVSMLSWLFFQGDDSFLVQEGATLF